MKRKREKLEVIYDILKVIQAKDGKIKPTHILYKSNLSHQMMNEYLEGLMLGKFLVEIKNTTGKSYKLTQKGNEYLEKYKVIVEFIDAFELNPKD